MSYVPHTAADVETMLAAVGAAKVEELFAEIPASLRERAALKLARPLDERELLAMLRDLAAQNASADRTTSFLGGGAYHHFTPSAVSALASRGEFLTAYTPYQAEVSQGTLQAIFEFQTLITQLTGLDVSNASLYDGASAAAEAALLCLRAGKPRKRIYLSEGIHPHHVAVIETYLAELDVEIERLPLDASGRTQTATLAPDTAAVLLQQPNFFGCIEDLGSHATAAHEAGGLLVSSTLEPLALALIKSPGECGADVACGEAQSFGVPLGYGGPYVGFMAARAKLVRQLPGRLVGESVDSAGERAFVMTLTTREQHIRREKATSNICTNQGLCALRVVIYLSLFGKRGLRHLARVNLSLAEYAKRKLREAGVAIPHAAPTFNEFVARVPDLAARLTRLEEQDILGGVRLETLLEDHPDELLVCATEMTSPADIDRLVEGLAS